MRRISILEDEPVLGKHLRRLLVRRGFAVELSTTLASFTTSARLRNFDICLIDFSLPDGDGLDAWQRVRPFHPGARALLMTAFCSRQLTLDAYRAGFDLVLSKPLDLNLLLHWIDTAPGGFTVVPDSRVRYLAQTSAAA